MESKKTTFIRTIIKIGDNQEELKKYLSSIDKKDLDFIKDNSNSSFIDPSVIEVLYSNQESFAISLLESYGFDINVDFHSSTGNLLSNAFRGKQVYFLKEILNCNNIKWNYFGDDVDEKDILELALDQGDPFLFKLALKIMKKYEIPFLEDNKYTEKAIIRNGLLPLNFLLKKGFKIDSNIVDLKLRQINSNVIMFENFSKDGILSLADKKMVIFLRRKNFLFENELNKYELNKEVKEWINSLAAFMDKKQLKKDLNVNNIPGNEYLNKKRL